MRQPRRAHQILGTMFLAAAFLWSAAPAAAQAPAPASPGAPNPAASQSDAATMRLSIDDAVALALSNNLGIQVQRLSPQIQDMNVSAARSNWTPVFNSSLNSRSQTQAATSSIQPSNTTDVFTTSIGADQRLPWGGSYSAAWSGGRVTSNNIFNTFSPQLQSNFQASYTQPLLRNFSIDSVRQQVQVNEKLRALSDIQLQTVIAQTVRNVKNAYWDLAYARDNLAATQQSLALAQQSLADNQKRVQVGTMAPIDIVQAEAEVANNQETVIVAQAAITNAEDRLRTLILDPDRPDFWTVSMETTDTAAFEAAESIDVDGAVRNALANRTDLRQAKNGLDQNDITIRYLDNQLKPDVSATVSYQALGVGGTRLEPVDPFSLLGGGPLPTRTVQSQSGFGSVLGDVFTNAYPTWVFGVTFGYPIGTSTDEANLARARLEQQQAQGNLKNLELQVAAQVRVAARQVQTNQQRVQAARASRSLQEQKLDAEEKKFAAGISTNFQVIQAQRDLALARTSEVQAIADYNKSLVDLESVQQVPLAGGM